MENAKKGVKKLFLSEILALITGVVALVSTVLTLVGLSQESAALTVISLVVVIVSLVITIVAAILHLLGIINASKDEPAFKMALWTLLAGLLFSLVGSILTAVAPNSSAAGLASDICNVLYEVASLATFLFVIQGIVNLADRCNKPDVVALGEKLKTIIVSIYILIIAVSILAMIFMNGFTAIIAAVAFIVAAVLTVVQYVLYLVLLGKAKKMFD